MTQQADVIRCLQHEQSIGSLTMRALVAVINVAAGGKMLFKKFAPYKVNLK